MDLADLRSTIGTTYLERDRARGVDATFRRFTEEVGELARAIRKDERSNLELELSDVLAWLRSLANLLDVDLDAVMTRYAYGCPKCHASPRTCSI